MTAELRREGRAGRDGPEGRGVPLSRLGVAGRGALDDEDGATATDSVGVGVDAAGRVWSLDGAWWLDWWIGADDRWHRPMRETAVRQHRLEDAPVVETLLRVPGGDGALRLYGVQSGGVAPGRGDEPDQRLGVGPHLVVEVVNRSRLPFAVAVVLCPARRPVLTGATLRLGDELALIGRRAPSRWATAAEEEALFDAVASGRTSEASGRSGPPDDGVVALVWPLAHGATLRLARPLLAPRAPAGQSRRASSSPTMRAVRGAGASAEDGPGDGRRPAGRGDGGEGGDGGDGARGAPSWPALPEGEQVARGWRRQLEATSRVDLPDARLQGTLSVARAELVLAATGEAGDPWVLARRVALLGAWGHDEDARDVLGCLALLGSRDDSASTQAAFLLAVAAYRRTSGDAGMVTAAEGEVVRAAALVGGALRARRSSGRWWRRVAPSTVGRGRARPSGAGGTTVDVSSARLEAASAAAAALAVPGGVPIGPGGGEVLSSLSPGDAGPWGTASRDDDRWSAELRALLDTRVAADGLAPRRVWPDDQPVTTAAGAGSFPTPAAVWDDELLWEVLASAHRALVGAVRGRSGEQQLVVLGAWPREWEGRSVEVHRLVVGAAYVSFAVRWHGRRPALLWDIEAIGEPGVQGVEPPILSSPGLDPRWLGRGWRGEALLEAPSGAAGAVSFS